MFVSIQFLPSLDTQRDLKFHIYCYILPVSDYKYKFSKILHQFRKLKALLLKEPRNYQISLSDADGLTK